MAYVSSLCRKALSSVIFLHQQGGILAALLVVYWGLII